MNRALTTLIENGDLPTSRSEAIARGIGQYCTGLPCRHGHVARRQVSNSMCVECVGLHNQSPAKKAWRSEDPERNAKQNARRAANRERHRALARASHARNREAANARSKAWRAKNPQRVKDNAKAWRASNPDEVRTAARNRKARLKRADGSHTSADVQQILNSQRFRCAECSADLRKHAFHVDHIVPLVRGGSNGRRNLQILCRLCNQQKHASDPIEFARKKGRLI